jgi:hypothetical protein
MTIRHTENISTGVNVMSVAGITSNALYDYSAQTIQNKLQGFSQAFQQLGQDLQSGNLSAAQTDFATLQKAGPQATLTAAAQSNNPISQDFNQLSQDLKSGNISAAQQDYTKVQQDFQSQQATGGHHHHHHGGGGSANSATSQLLEELGQDLQTNNLTAAQQEYGALQQDLPLFAQTTGQNQTPSALNPSGFSVSA